LKTGSRSRGIPAPIVPRNCDGTTGNSSPASALKLLVDPGSFVELDRFARHRAHGFGLEKDRAYGDGVVTGHGAINGRRVFVLSQDATVFGGSIGEVCAEKIVKVMRLAAQSGCPVVGLYDSGGARIQEGVVSLAGVCDIFYENVRVSGVVAQASVILGPCAGGAAYSPALTDALFMVEGTSYMFVTGPDVVKTVMGEGVTMEDLGGANVHAAKSGVAHVVAPDEQSVLEDVRTWLSYLPQNNVELPPMHACHDPIDRDCPSLDVLVPENPNKPYRQT
jgi:propionyl-CoA carboxylase beta chain